MKCASYKSNLASLAHKIGSNIHNIMDIFTKALFTAMLSPTVFTINAAEENKLVLNVSEPGTLSSIITKEQISSTTDLTLTGKINSTDVKLIRRMAGLDEYGDPVEGNHLENLNLSGADIVEGGEPYFYTYTTENDIVGDFFFNKAIQLKSIIIPTSAKGIKWSAVSECTGITEFTIPDNVTYIDQAAFESDSNLKEVKFGKSLSSIFGYAFKDCASLQKADLPEGLTTLDEFVFSGCTALESVNIPGSVDNIGQFAFYENTNLSDVNIASGVKGICKNAFSDCKGLKTLVIPNSVTTIEESAFYGCEALTSISLPDNLTEITESMLSGCSSLQTLKIPEKVKKIGESAFCYDENILTISLPEGVTEIGDNAFFDCEKMKYIYIGKDLQLLGKDAFKFCEALETINIDKDNAIYSTAEGVLYNKEMTKLLFLPPANTEEYTVPETVTELAMNCAITNTKLRKLTISDNVETIGEGAFQTCTNLESVVIGSGVKEVGEDVFFMDENIKEIHCRMTQPIEINEYFFGDVDCDNCKLYVPKGSLEAYSAAEVWKEFKNIIEEGTSSIDNINGNGNTITINGNALGYYDGGNISIYNSNGCLIYSGNDNNIQTLEKGLIIVKTGNKTQKLIIK